MIEITIQSTTVVYLQGNIGNAYVCTIGHISLYKLMVYI